jgi:hypothetical protein
MVVFDRSNLAFECYRFVTVSSFFRDFLQIFTTFYHPFLPNFTAIEERFKLNRQVPLNNLRYFSISYGLSLQGIRPSIRRPASSPFPPHPKAKFIVL